MKHAKSGALRRILTYLKLIPLRAIIALQVFASTEPVRLRAALTSIVTAAALVVPVLGTPGVAEKIGAVGVVLLPIVVGESARKRVSPV